MIVDQSVDGLEVLRGSSTYTYEGNWKLTAENGADGYHVSAVHWNYAATTNHRKQENSREDQIRAMDAGSWGRQGGGFYAFEHGHMLLWSRWANPEDRPNFSRRDEFAARCGAETADWMIQNSRNLPVSECLPDGPVRLADPRIAAALGQQDGSHDLLHRTEGRAR
jgi:benzoate/toluate 1,2-dioxygenase alpha subunit